MSYQALRYTYLDSPVGGLLLAGDEEMLHYLSFPKGHKAFGPKDGWLRDDTILREARAQLSAYFAGDLRVFDLALAPHGTPFQMAVWKVLATIPFGETRSYGWLAREIGADIRASRAVGAANGANPIPIILPCHRVIGATGKLTGFGGGIETKKFLLELEGADVGGDGGQMTLF